MSNSRTRIRVSAVIAVLVLAGIGQDQRANGDDPRFEIRDVKTISQQSALYCGWPTVSRFPDGRLMVVWSGGRESHVCPFGRVESMTSSDGGETWSWPRVLLDSAIDDRDAGILATAQGTLLVSTFSSLAYVPVLERARESGSFEAGRLAKWESAHRRLTEEQRQLDLGTWMLRSTDGGLTWSPRYDALVNSPHGPAQLVDGRLLYAGKELWKQSPRNGVVQSNDDGLTWKWLAEIPTRPGDDPLQYHELHAIEADPGHVIVQIRNHNPPNNMETLQCESTDGGKTWSVPRSIGVWGVPSHLLKLSDGRLLMSYGHRRKPLGNQARISTDQGKTWSDPMVIYAEAHDTDMGYPSTVELAPGELLTVWYEVLPTSPRATLRQMRWRLK